MNQFYKQFSAEYDCGAYGTSTYNSNQACETTTDSGSGLANTGTNITVGITGGVLLVAVAIVILVKTRRKSKTNQNN